MLRFHAPPLGRRLRIALAGMPGAGRRTLFDAVASTMPQCGTLAGGGGYRECAVQVGRDEASVLELPAMRSLQDPAARELAAVDLVLQVADATDLAPHLELALELRASGRPMILALNRIDEAWHKGMYVNAKALARLLGVPVVPISALLGKGIAELFTAALGAARAAPAPMPGVRIAECLEAAMRPGAPREDSAWRYWLDELMLHPRWGLVGSAA
ncbi:MAG: FeoB small GTPase domain-containing protein, partial [Pseudomonadota bacterium]